MQNTNKYLSSEMRDLPLFEVEARLCQYKRQLQRELRHKGVSFDFHIWVSDEWFCPDGVPGFAVPYYLFNTDLMKLHKRHVGFVEGTTDTQIMKLMRHELGHAIDNAFGLRKSKSRQTLFGSSKKEYPESYTPNPVSKKFVHYLGDHYAQSHPDEDFAETFAYWLDPVKDWESKKLSLQVKEKLNWFQLNVKGLSQSDRILKNQFRVEAIEKNKRTLSGYFRQLQKSYGQAHYGRVDRSLKVAFPQGKAGLKLSSLIRKHRKKLEAELSNQLGVRPYEVGWALKRLAFRGDCLEIRSSEQDFRLKSISMVQKNYRYLKQSNQLKFYL